MVLYILCALRQMPLIKRLLPVDLYQSHTLKIIASIISGIGRFFSIFVGKIIYVGLMIFLVSTLFKSTEPNAFLHIFVFVSLTGAIINTQFFDPSQDKYYAIELLRMNAKKYILVNYLLFLGQTLIGMLPAFLIFGKLAGVSIWICCTMPLFVICVKSCYAALLLFYAHKKNKVLNENALTKMSWVAIFVLVLCGYGLPFLHIVISSTLYVGLLIGVVGASIPSFLFLFRYNHYRKIAKDLLTHKNIVFDLQDTLARASVTTSQRNIDNKVKIKSGKNGYDYFHDIFVQRHRRILAKPIWIMSCICLAVMLGMMIGVLFSDYFALKVNDLILTTMPFFLFIMYLLNRGEVMTRAMFMNCDHSMLTYRFYRQPKIILGLFTKRLLTIITMNLIPSMMIAIGLPLLLLLSGGTSQPIYYGILFFTILAMSVFFSVHSLTMYYLLQPYNVDLQSKSGIYALVRSMTYIVAFMLARIPIPTLLFGILMMAFALFYVALALLLTYHFAPKTFKLR